MSALETTVLAGLAAGGLASLVRALPWPAECKKKKPISCDVCLTLHTVAYTICLLSGLGVVKFRPWAMGLVTASGALVIAAVLVGMAMPAWSGFLPPAESATANSPSHRPARDFAIGGTLAVIAAVLGYASGAIISAVERLVRAGV